MEPDAIPNSQPLVEIQQVDAAAQQNVLAVVDGFGRLAIRPRQRIRGSPSAQKRPRFVQVHLEARAPQGRRRR